MRCYSLFASFWLLLLSRLPLVYSTSTTSPSYYVEQDGPDDHDYGENPFGSNLHDADYYCPARCLSSEVGGSTVGGGGGSSTIKQHKVGGGIRSNLSRLWRSGSCNGHDDTKTSVATTTRILYLIAVHDKRTMEDAVHVFRAIRDPRNIILIHVDSKVSHLIGASGDNQTSTLSSLQREIAACSCGSTVRVEAVHNVQWSKWSMNLPTLWALTTGAQEYKDRWDVFINLSGDSLAVYNADRTAEILSQLPYNFVTSSSCATGFIPTNVYQFPPWWHKRGHYTRRETEPGLWFVSPTAGVNASEDSNDNGNSSQQRPTGTVVETHFGSQWMILRYDFCLWLIQELERPDSLPSLYRQYLLENEFLMSDETFFSTVLVHSPFANGTMPVVDEETGFLLWKNGSASAIRAVRYERMDEHVPTATGVYPTKQRYEQPVLAADGAAAAGAASADKKSGSSSNRPWGPYFLGAYDLADIRSSGALFVRKVSATVDFNLVRILPVDRSEDIPDIRWPNEVRVSDKPEWDPILSKMFLLQLKRQYYQGDHYQDDQVNDDSDEL